MQSYILAHLEKYDIHYVLHTHPPVFTCADAEKHCCGLPGLSCKALFLKGKKGEGYYLVLMPANKRLDMKILAPLLSAKELTFAKPAELQAVLGLEPGSVSPLGLLNDHRQQVSKLLVEKDVFEAPVVSFHPNINTETLEFEKTDFHKLLASFPHGYVVANL